MIVIDHLTKRHGASTAVDDVSFTCRPGTVTGFLGPNGAGKSSTLRVLCGLDTPTSGRATIDGVGYRELPQPARRVGVLLDASAQHPGRTGRESLRLAVTVLGLPRRRADEMLELVGLGDAGGRRIGQYSLGMRQRLGLAMALIGDPGVLILDEPANGLDPAGIHWMRGLLRGFAEKGGTVLVSTHLLREVEAVADHYVIIGEGKVLAEGGTDELHHHRGGVLARALDPDGLESTLRQAGLPYRPQPDGHVLVDARPEDVGRAAAASGTVLLEMREPDDQGLEDLFLSLTEGSAR